MTAFQNLLARLSPSEASSLSSAARLAPQIIPVLLAQAETTEKARAALLSPYRVNTNDSGVVATAAVPHTSAAPPSFPLSPAALPNTGPSAASSLHKTHTALGSSFSSGDKNGVQPSAPSTEQAARLVEQKKALLSRLSAEGRRVAVEEATERANRAIAMHASASARLEAIPLEACALEQRLELSLGAGAAQVKSATIRRGIDARRQLLSRVAFQYLACADPLLLEEDAGQAGVRVSILEEDVKACRFLLEQAGTEHAKQPWETELNPSVLQMCAEQARRLRENAAKELAGGGGGFPENTQGEGQAGVSAGGELEEVLTRQVSGMQRLCSRVRRLTEAMTMEVDWELAEVRAEYAESVQARAQKNSELVRVREQQTRVEEEFFNLRATVERFKESEATQESELSKEVERLERDAERKRIDAQAAWASEMETVRKMAAAEAEVRCALFASPFPPCPLFLFPLAPRGN